MKRNHKQKYSHLYKCYPLFFWKKCCDCNMEFRRERGWRALTGPFYGGSGLWRYLCNSCGPDLESANDYFLNDKWLPRTPPPRSGHSFPPKPPSLT